MWYSINGEQLKNLEAEVQYFANNDGIRVVLEKLEGDRVSLLHSEPYYLYNAAYQSKHMPPSMVWTDMERLIN